MKTIFVSLCILLFGVSCNSQSNQESHQEEQTNSEETMKNDNRNQELDSLVKSLNFWMEGGGDPDHRAPNKISTGESSSAFTNTKNKIEALGGKVAWKDNKYVLVEE